MTDIPFDITARPGLELAVEAFKANFSDGLEHGAQFCAYQNGELLLDLKGGWADRRKTQPVTDDTLFAVFSSGKAVAALVIATLADDDRLGYEQPVRSIWKEFTSHGKGKLTVAQIMSHQAGLSGITDPNWTVEDWYDWEKVCATLAAQEPLFAPGSASGYHPVTYGFLAGEIARLTDSGGRSLGQILHQDICAPLGLDIWIGLPETEHARCADMIKPRALADLGEINPATQAAFLSPTSSPAPAGLTQWREAELAGSNCHATAKALAQIMQMAIDGTVCGQKFLAEDVTGFLSQPRISGPNLVLPFDITFAAGLMHNASNYFYGPNPETLGHSGWGGSCVFADPVTGITGAYAMSRQDNTLLGDTRPRRIIDALYEAIV